MNEQLYPLFTNPISYYNGNDCHTFEYLTYNYNLLNIDYDEFKRRYEYNFLLWHKEKCINSKHKFLITKFDTHLLFYCYDCHVEQIFMT